MSNDLDKMAGPECPACGCPDSEVLIVTERTRSTVERRICMHCGRVFRNIIQKEVSNDQI
jgi:uncharacterized Zn finger protein